MHDLKHGIAKFINDRSYELAVGGVSFIGRIVIDWNHIAEKAIETTIIAFMNGGAAAFGAFIFGAVIKKIIKKFIN